MLWRRAKRRGPLILLLHGHGADEHDIFPLQQAFPPGASVAALRGPIASEGGYRWYAHHAVGRPIAASLAGGIAYVEAWLGEQDSAQTWLVGFSGGATMAGALIASAPQRFAGAALLHGALPFESGVPLEPGRLGGCEVFFGYGELDTIVPPALIARTRAYLRDESGARAELHGYRAGHEIVPAAERDLTRWYAGLT